MHGWTSATPAGADQITVLLVLIVEYRFMTDSKREQTLEEMVHKYSRRADGIMLEEEALELARAVERRTAERCAEIVENAMCADTVQQRIHVANLRREFNLEKP